MSLSVGQKIKSTKQLKCTLNNKAVLLETFVEAMGLIIQNPKNFRISNHTGEILNFDCRQKMRLFYILEIL